MVSYFFVEPRIIFTASSSGSPIWKSLTETGIASCIAELHLSSTKLSVSDGTGLSNSI